MIVDAHHHLWDPARRDYPWMTGDADVLRRPFGLGDLRATVEPLDVGATVAVQAASTEEETGRSCSRSPPSPTGSWPAWSAGSTSPRPRPASGSPLCRRPPAVSAWSGSRHAVHDEPDPAWLDRDDVGRGLRAVAQAGLPYDLLLFPQHLAPAERIAAALPGARARGRPRRQAPLHIAAGEREPWSSDLAALAAHEHVHCKLSGLVTEADWRDWREQDVGSYARAAARAVRPRAADVRLRLAGLHARRPLRRGARARPRRARGARAPPSRTPCSRARRGASTGCRRRRADADEKGRR